MITAAKNLSAKPKKVDKREAIIEAGQVLFTTQGYESTTIAEVARKAGVAVGTVYLYFKNKPELLMAIKNSWENRFIRFMARPDIQSIPHHLRARALIEAAFTIAGQNIEMIQLMGLQPQMIGGSREQPVCGPIEQALEGFIQDGIAAGAFRPVDPKISATISFGMVHTAFVQCFEGEKGSNRERYINTLVDAFENWLGRPEVFRSSNS